MQSRNYIETQILGATRIELVRLAYQGAIAAVRDARRCLASGERAQRASAVTKAMDFLSELTLSLNHEAGGKVSANLAEVYGYVQRLLVEAHVKQSDEKLAEAVDLLEILLDAWREVRNQDEDCPNSFGELSMIPGGSSLAYDGESGYIMQARSWSL